MKAKKPVAEKRKQYTEEYKKQVLVQAEKDGVKATAEALKLKPEQLYAWRQATRRKGLSTEEEQLQQVELLRLKRENTRLEEEVAFLKKAAAYFAKQPK